MIRELIPRAESLGNDVGCEVRFGMNTNGLALTEETIEFLTQHRVGVAISIDGTARQHDMHRVFKNGAGSYKSLESRITKFLPLYGQYSKIKTCRITAAETDFDFLEAVDHVVKLGFNNIGLGLGKTLGLGGGSLDSLMGGSDIANMVGLGGSSSAGPGVLSSLGGLFGGGAGYGMDPALAESIGLGGGSSLAGLGGFDPTGGWLTGGLALDKATGGGIGNALGGAVSGIGDAIGGLFGW